jgi:uncharacterized protein (DUF934 family)
MPLIKDGQIVEDAWRVLEDGEALPESGDVIVPLERLKDEADAIRARSGRTGVALANTDEPDEVQPYLADLDVIALHFPAFTDGRAYSQARQLRTSLGYKGELRATGNVLADQAAFLARVGFDSFEVDSTQSIDVWNQALRSMSVAYQRGYDGDQTTRYQAPSSSASPAAQDTART